MSASAPVFTEEELKDSDLQRLLTAVPALGEWRVRDIVRSGYTVDYFQRKVVDKLHEVVSEVLFNRPLGVYDDYQRALATAMVQRLFELRRELEAWGRGDRTPPDIVKTCRHFINLRKLAPRALRAWRDALQITDGFKIEDDAFPELSDKVAEAMTEIMWIGDENSSGAALVGGAGSSLSGGAGSVTSVVAAAPVASASAGLSGGRRPRSRSGRRSRK